MTRYQALAAVTALATLALIGIGAVVRTTGSGLGCPDWPLCHGELFPPAEKTAIIEYSHRTAAAIVGVLLVATVAVTLLRHSEDRTLRKIAIAALPLLALQAWLGKEAVERELPAELVTFHLGMAMVLLAVLSLIAAFAYLGPNRRRIADPQRSAFVRLAAGVSMIVLAVVLIGSYVVGSDAMMACTTWPGCSQAPIPFLDGIREQHIHWLHRLTVLAGFAGVVAIALRASQLSGAGPLLRGTGWALVVLYTGQMLLGAATIWTSFSEVTRTAHLVGGASIWGLCVLIVVGAAFRGGAHETMVAPSATLPEREPARA